MRLTRCAPFLRSLALGVGTWAATSAAQALGYMPWAHVIERVMSQPAPMRAQLINHVVNDFDYHPGEDPARAALVKGVGSNDGVSQLICHRSLSSKAGLGAKRELCSHLRLEGSLCRPGF